MKDKFKPFNKSNKVKFNKLQDKFRYRREIKYLAKQKI